MNFRSFVFVSGFLAVAGGCSDPQAQNPPTQPSQKEREIRLRVDEAVASGFSGAILVTLEGRRLLAEGHGFHRRRSTSARS